jgi:hypothetical protein
MNIPESMTLETLWRYGKPTQFLANTNGQAFKLIQTGMGKRKLVIKLAYPPQSTTIFGESYFPVDAPHLPFLPKEDQGDKL